MTSMPSDPEGRRKRAGASIYSILFAGCIFFGQATIAASDPAPARYRIQISDVIDLSFPLSPEFNQTVTVQPDGYVEIAGGQDVHAAGMTIPELMQAIKESYGATLHNPIVAVSLKDYDKPAFYVTGQVGHPGRYELRSATTVTQAIAIAGGINLQAKYGVYLVRPVSASEAEVRKVNLDDTFEGKHQETNSLLMPGDVLYVPESLVTTFRKYIPYYLGANLASIF
jgi:polysaccharide export outer membrane protein